MATKKPVRKKKPVLQNQMRPTATQPADEIPDDDGDLHYFQRRCHSLGAAQSPGARYERFVAQTERSNE